jgi:hypothetical protein
MKVAILFSLLLFTSIGEAKLSQEVFWGSTHQFNLEHYEKLLGSLLLEDKPAMEAHLSSVDRELLKTWREQTRDKSFSIQWSEDFQALELKAQGTTFIISQLSLNPPVMRVNGREVALTTDTEQAPTMSSIIQELARLKVVSDHRSSWNWLLNEAHAAPVVLLAVPGLVTAAGMLYIIWLGNAHPDYYSNPEKYRDYMRGLRMKCDEDLNHLAHTPAGNERSFDGLIAAHELNRIVENVRETVQHQDPSRAIEQMQSCSEIGRQMTSTLSVFREMGLGTITSGEYSRHLREGCEEFKSFLSCMEEMRLMGERRGLTSNDRRLRYKGFFGGVRTNSEYRDIIEFYRRRGQGASR